MFTYNCQLSLLTSAIVNFNPLFFATADEDACEVKSTGHTPALVRREACASVDSAYSEGEDEEDTSSESDLGQELETARAEVAKHEYLVFGRPDKDSPVF